MAEGPIDYSLGVQQTPLGSFAGGYSVGQGIRDDQQQQAALRASQQQATDQHQALLSLVNNPNAGARDYANATLLMPQLKDQFKQAWDMKNTDQQDAALRNAGQAMAAITSGRPDIAVQQMQQRADAMEKSGASPQEVQTLRTYAQLVQTHPEYGRSLIGTQLASFGEKGEKVLSGLTSVGTEQRAQAQAPADLAIKNAQAGIQGAQAAVAPQKNALDLANTTSQINERAARLGLDQDKLTSETQLKVQEMRQKAGEVPEPVMNNINAATGEAIASQQSAQKMNGLADQIDKLAPGMFSGRAGTVGEYFKTYTGFQNEITNLRAEYNRIVTPAAMAAYKTVASGSTSDKDIETAMTGVPKDTDSPERMASFLRGAAKLQVYNSVLNNAKSEWFAANRHLGKISKDAEIDGVQVPAGTTFKGFADQYVAKKVGQVQGAQTVNSLAAKYSGGASGSY